MPPKVYGPGYPRPVTIKITPTVHKQLRSVSLRMTREKGRQVTTAEVIELALERSGMLEAS